MKLKSIGFLWLKSLAVLFVMSVTSLSAGEVTDFTLVNASTNSDIGQLTDGAEVDLSTVGSSLNIRANISGIATQVNFTLSGAMTHSQSEGIAPYALYGDTSGVYTSWTPVIGSYTLTANCDGVGIKTISFTVIEGGTPPPEPPPEPVPGGTYLESAGLLVMEMENTASDLGNWFEDTNVAGFTGSGYLEFDGNSPLNGPPDSPLEFNFKITKPGLYYLHLHCARENVVINGETRTDVANDAYVRVDGDYNAGPNAGNNHGDDAPLSMLKSDTKFFGGNHNQFVWASGNRLDPGGHNNKRVAVYDFKAGETYKLVIHGRSQYFKVNRIVFRHIDTAVNTAQNLNNPESQIQAADSDGDGTVTISGELKQWHRVSLKQAAKYSSEMATPNPFRDYRFNVEFTAPSGKKYLVPGYFATDGDGGDDGNVWIAHLNPDETGEWNYEVSFRSGADIAVSLDVNAGTALSPFDGKTDTFTVAASDKTGNDFRAADKGMLINRGHHYLTYGASGKPFLYTGPGIPENILGYRGFTNTTVGVGHNFDAHLTHWNNGDPDWNNGEGKKLIGALNYIADQGANCLYMMSNTIGGDGQDCFPHPTSSSSRDRYDLLKLRQWDIALAHAQKKGIFLHWHLAEHESGNNTYYGGQGTDNKNVTNTMTVQRKLSFRMLNAVFGHYNALKWNIMEECEFATADRIAQMEYIKAIDPYDHPVTYQVGGAGIPFNTYDSHLGQNNGIDAGSFQGSSSRQTMFNQMQEWRNKSAGGGVPWTCAWDEPQTIHNDNNDEVQGYPMGRRDKMWPCLMGGGDGFMWYIQKDGGGHGFDQRIEDFTIMQNAFNWCGHIRTFLGDLPLVDMSSSMSVVTSSAGNDYALVKAGEIYAIFNDRAGSGMTLDLSGVNGTFEVKWFDPRNGGDLQDGTVTTISGGGIRNLGSAPNNTDKDWAVLVKNTEETGKKICYIHGDVSADGTIPSGSDPAYDQMLLTDSGNNGLSEFKAMVEAEGYNISQHYDADTTLDAAFLNQFDVVIFGLHQKIWSASEKSALDTWLRNGGGAWFYSDSAAGGLFSSVGAQNPVGQTAVNNVISQYGMEVLVDQANGVKAYRAGPGASHPVVDGRPVLEGEGVSPVAVDPNSNVQILIPYEDNPDYKVSGNATISHTQNVSISNPQYAALATVDVGSGRIMAMFDRQPMWNNGPGSDIDMRDNRDILLRIVKYLAGDLQVTGQQPYNGTPIAIPGQIQAEEYDLGGAGIAYFDTTTGNSGSTTFRAAEDVDTTGTVIGWIAAGEWVEYTVDVSSAGLYDLDLRVSSASAGGSIRIEFNGVDKTGSITVPVTGSWGSYTTVTVPGLQLDAGQQVMRIVMETAGFNVDYATFSEAVANTAPTANAGPNQTLTDSDGNGNESVTLNGSGSGDSDGTIVSYLWSIGGSQIATGANPTVNLSVGTHTVTLTVTDDAGATDSDTVLIIVNAVSNAAPTANAGADQTVEDSDSNGSESVTLDGSSSSDSDGTIASYIWTAGGSQVATGANPAVNLSVGTHTITLTVTDDDGATDTDEVTITVEEPVEDTVVAAINCGGSAYTSVDGIQFSADTYSSGGNTYSTGHTISGTEDDSLYQSERWGNPFSYNIPVANGTYSVTLKLAEIYQTAAGTRIFTVTAEGAEVVSNLDLFALVGHDAAHDVTFEVVVSDGQLNLNFTATQNNGKCSAILVSSEVPNSPPAADAGVDQTVEDSDGSGSESVTLNGTDSSDSDGTIASFIWSEGGTEIATGVNPSIDLAVGTHTITLTVTDDDGATDTDTVVVTVEEAPVASVIAAINCGGGAYTSVDGTQYSADTYTSGGRTYSTGHAITGTEDDVLYQTERWGNPFSYNIPVANGTYNVTLKLAEIYQTTAGSRIFTVTAEGSTVVTDLDLFSLAGHDAAYDVTFEVTVNDSQLNLAFAASQDNGKIGAVLVTQSGSSAAVLTGDEMAAVEESRAVTLSDGIIVKTGHPDIVSLNPYENHQDFVFALDALTSSAVTKGDFLIKVITAEGEFIFYLSAGEEFRYAILSDNEFSVTYTDSDEIIEMLSKLFDSEEILNIQVLVF